MTPEDRERAQGLARLAAAELASGDHSSAADHSHAALKLDSNCLHAHAVLAHIALTGDHYQIVLERVHALLRPRTYLEIGVEAGVTLRLASPVTMVIGVDPAPQIAERLGPNVRVFRATSDHFFAHHDAAREFGGKPIDLAFIDGKHLFEFALRDFINVERNAAPTSTILLHDCYPLDEVTAQREPTTTFWTGDVWKLVLCLKKYRPDLKIQMLASPPSGLTVVRGLDPASQTLPSRLEALYDEFIGLPYAALGDDKQAALNLLPGDWGTARSLLA